jgi:hypothetical protein
VSDVLVVNKVLAKREVVVQGAKQPHNALVPLIESLST